MHIAIFQFDVSFFTLSLWSWVLINYLDFIREIPDFPKQGILFKDITPLLKDSFAFQSAVGDMSQPFMEKSIDSVVAIEARGYIFGAPIAYQLGCGFIPIRKKGKLPGKTSQIEYSLEYGTEILEIHSDSVDLGRRILIVDDILATGGTLQAAVELVKESGGEIAGISVFADLVGLEGAKNFSQYSFASLLHL